MPINYNFDSYFARRVFDTDTVTGLKREIRAVRLESDAKEKTVTVFWEVCLTSPTNAVMEVLQSGSFVRFNGEIPKYDLLRESAVGQGISQMVEQLDFAIINSDFSNFPDCLNQE